MFNAAKITNIHSPKTPCTNQTSYQLQRRNDLVRELRNDRMSRINQQKQKIIVKPSQSNTINFQEQQQIILQNKQHLDQVQQNQLLDKIASANQQISANLIKQNKVKQSYIQHKQNLINERQSQIQALRYEQNQEQEWERIHVLAADREQRIQIMNEAVTDFYVKKLQKEKTEQKLNKVIQKKNEIVQKEMEKCQLKIEKQNKQRTFHVNQKPLQTLAVQIIDAKIPPTITNLKTIGAEVLSRVRGEAKEGRPRSAQVQTEKSFGKIKQEPEGFVAIED
ncbi:Hypothetical_protein [Hexamita inflata]|uniref:Hypothetical_protein n=1 Tax=Hexamita inflata TaxID=28002 RepID=A0AA86NX69_9EUKA|nr:Hypothetical protein HINF_LOCUS15313 [Hexamita inflata]